MRHTYKQDSLAGAKLRTRAVFSSKNVQIVFRFRTEWGAGRRMITFLGLGHTFDATQLMGMGWVGEG